MCWLLFKTLSILECNSTKGKLMLWQSTIFFFFPDVITQRNKAVCTNNNSNNLSFIWCLKQQFNRAKQNIFKDSFHVLFVFGYKYLKKKWKFSMKYGNIVWKYSLFYIKMHSERDLFSPWINQVIRELIQNYFSQ